MPSESWPPISVALAVGARLHDAAHAPLRHRPVCSPASRPRRARWHGRSRRRRERGDAQHASRDRAGRRPRRSGAPGAPERLVGHRAADRDRDDAVRLADRVLLLPALPGRRVAAGGHLRAERRRCRSSLTGVLVATSVPMLLAARAARAGRARAAWLAIGAAALVQAGYLARADRRSSRRLPQVQPTGSAYGSIYFTLLVAHHAHVAVGLLIDVWLLARLAVRAHELPRDRGARRRALLVLRQRRRDRGRADPALAVAMRLSGFSPPLDALLVVRTAGRAGRLDGDARRRLRADRGALRPGRGTMGDRGRRLDDRADGGRGGDRGTRRACRRRRVLPYADRRGAAVARRNRRRAGRIHFLAVIGLTIRRCSWRSS